MSSAQEPSANPAPEAPVNTRRGWAIPTTIWFTIAICATVFDGCAGLTWSGALIGAMLSDKEQAKRNEEKPVLFLQPPAQRKNDGFRPELVMSPCVLILTLVWVAVHWGLIWFRRANLNSFGNGYWTWTCLHGAWTVLACLAVLVELVGLGMVCMGKPPMGIEPGLDLMVFGTGVHNVFNILAVAGWVIIVFALPPTKSASTGDAPTLPTT